VVQGGELHREGLAMLSGQRFKTWNIFDSALVKNANGHHYWETKGLVDELIGRRETVRLFSHLAAPTAEEFPGTEIVPVFSLFLYVSVSNDPTWSTLENFIVHNRTFAHELSRLDPGLFRDSLVLFPTVGESQLLGIVRWLGTLPQGNGTKAAICMYPPREWSNADHSVGLYRTVWKDCPPEVRNGIALFARTRQIAEMFATHAGMPVDVFPYPIPEQLLEARRSSAGTPGGPMVVSFVGGPRRERGGELIPDVVKQCSGSGTRFFIQVRRGGHSDFDEQVLLALAGLPHVHVHEGPLERSAYYRAIGESVVLLAYQASRYRWRDSGVYHEAKLLDAPVLVSAGTWMADEVTALGNGLVIEDHSAAAIADCIAHAQRELPALKAAAVRIGRDARDRNGVGRCVEAIAARFANAGESAS
jgi:hypothetical protein